MTDATKKPSVTTRKSSIDDLKNWLKKNLIGKDKKVNEAFEKLSREDFEGLSGWLLENNQYAFFDEDERDEKKSGPSADRIANRLVMAEATGLSSIAIGMAILPLCPVMGIFIIASGTIPNPVMTEMKKYVAGETLGFVPLDKIPSPSESMADYAHNKHASIDAQMTNFYKVLQSAEKKQKEEVEKKKYFQNIVNNGNGKNGSSITIKNLVK